MGIIKEISDIYIPPFIGSKEKKKKKKNKASASKTFYNSNKRCNFIIYI